MTLEITPGELSREPNSIKGYLRENQFFPVSPVEEFIIIRSGQIEENQSVTISFSSLLSPIRLLSIWVATQLGERRDNIRIQILENNQEIYYQVISQNQLPQNLPYNVIIPSQELVITPSSTVKNVTFIAKQCFIIGSLNA